MVKLNKTTLARIAAQAKEKEEDLLVDFLLNNDDENVYEALQQALAVVKLIFSEEIDAEINAYRDSLIADEENEIARKRAEKERRKIEERHRKIMEQDDWRHIIDDFKKAQKDGRWGSVDPNHKWEKEKAIKEAIWRISNTLNSESDALWKSYRLQRWDDDDK